MVGRWLEAPLPQEHRLAQGRELGRKAGQPLALVHPSRVGVTVHLAWAQDPLDSRHFRGSERLQMGLEMLSGWLTGGKSRWDPWPVSLVTSNVCLMVIQSVEGPGRQLGGVPVDRVWASGSRAWSGQWSWWTGSGPTQSRVHQGSGVRAPGRAAPSGRRWRQRLPSAGLLLVSAGPQGNGKTSLVSKELIIHITRVRSAWLGGRGLVWIQAVASVRHLESPPLWTPVYSCLCNCWRGWP